MKNKSCPRCDNKYRFPERESVAHKCVGVIETSVDALNTFLANHNIGVTITSLDLGYTRDQMNERRANAWQ
ncbi:MAG: hypothetical protein V3U74_05485 [Thermodesulfobacteriota bacterium]